VADLLTVAELIFDTCGQPLITPTWTGVRLIETTSYHTCFVRSEVVVLLPLFAPVLTGVRQCSCVVFSISVSFIGQPCWCPRCGLKIG
jgi:hypothetical protein